MKRLLQVFLGIGGAIYLLNLGFGIGELIPDNLPLAGNLDEALASMFVFNAFSAIKRKQNGA